MLKRYLLLFTALLFINNCFAQDTIEIKRKLSGHVTEIFKVLKSNVNIRQGSFRALYKNKIPVASGMYENDKKVDLWRFTDPNGVVIQTYDYTRNRLFYEAPEDTTSHLTYMVDQPLKEGDRVIRPIKIGGRFYGYLPYLTLFTLPNEFRNIDREDITAVVELLISPGGRLADYKVILTAGVLNTPLRTVNMNIKLPDPADLVFMPAKLNGEPIACRISIACVVNTSWHLDFE